MSFAVEALVLQQCVRVTNSGDSGKNCKGAVYVLQRKIRSLILRDSLIHSVPVHREQQEQTPVLHN